MTMRNAMAIGAMVLLGACGGGNDQTTATTPTNASASAPAASSAPATQASSAAPAATTTTAPAASSSSSAAPKLGAEGATCGGIAAIQCATGLKCVMTGPTHPDQSGTCKKP
jgi:thiol:disulfide interchange protein DsbA